MAEARDARELVEAQAAERDDAEFFPINKLPNDVLVSVFSAVVDQVPADRRNYALLWVRHVFPCVCKAWNELYRSRDASPLHETLEVDFEEEVLRAELAVFEKKGRGRRDPVSGRPLRPVVHASRAISWAERRAGTIHKLHLTGELGHGALKYFSAKDLGALVAVVAPSLTELSIGPFLGELCKRPFWDSLRDRVVPAGRLRSLAVGDVDADSFGWSDVEPVLGQLAGSLEELKLISVSRPSPRSRFPESLLALKELRRLVLFGEGPRITAIPAGISSLKKLEALEIERCGLSSLPKELSELSGLTKLELGGNEKLGNRPQDEAFPAELGKMKSLRYLSLHDCGLRSLPAFVGELKSLEGLDLHDNDFSSLPKELGGLKSLEVLDIFGNARLQVDDAPLDFLFEGCPRLLSIRLWKGRSGGSWTRKSLAHLTALEAKLQSRNPEALLYFERS